MPRYFWTAAVLLCAVVGRTNAQSPNDVIINEILLGSSAGLKDAVELLVLKPGGLDMRGWTLTDKDTSTATGEITLLLPSNPFLANVPTFTRVVLISNDGGSLPVTAEDTVAAGDSTIVLISNFAGGTLIQSANSSFLGSSDNLALISGPDMATGAVIDIVIWGGLSRWTGATWINNLNLSVDKVAYFTSQASGSLVNDDGADGWFTAPLESNHTLGQVNPGQFLEGKPLRITGLSHNPLSPTSVQPVTVAVTIGVAHTLLAARAVFTVQSVIDSADLVNVSDSTFEGQIAPKAPGSSVAYFVRAYDNMNNTAVSDTGVYAVQDAFRFGSITRAPLTPDSTQEVLVTAVIVPSTTLGAARLFYTRNSVTDSVDITAANDTTYEGVIPPHSTGTQVDYFVKAYDGQGFAAISSTASYAVIEPISFTPISTIQANPALYYSSSVTVTGIITVGDGKLSTSQRRLYVTNSSGTGVRGIQIFSFTLPGPADSLRRGDSVIVTGYLKDFSGTTEITDTTGFPLTITVVSSGNDLPAPRRYSISQIKDLSLEGEWVQIKGLVTGSVVAGAGTNVTVDDGTSSITVRVENATGIAVGTVLPSQSTFIISGPLNIFSNATQVYLAYASDVTPDTAGVVTTARANIRVSPHPFNPRAGEVIKYALTYGANTRVIVRLYDVSGRLVSTLVDEVKAAGRDESKDPFSYRTWNGRTKETQELVPIGTYILHLEVTERLTGKSSTKTAPVVVGTRLK